MAYIEFQNGSYRTKPVHPSLFARLAPTVRFYATILHIVFCGGRLAKLGRYGEEGWNRNSIETLLGLERVGGTFEIDGIENFRSLNGPCVFIGNHMSVLETFVLPVLINPFKRVTFVVKQSLVDYPFFKHIMRSRDPITVGRTNPREDLKAVLEGGEARLKNGTSIIIFPQTTRTEMFDPAQFNTIGVKLAKRAGVPIVPVALLTDAWAGGRLIKDFGRVDPSKPAYISFGPAMTITGRGDEEHQKTIEFISGKLRQWGGKIAGRSETQKA